MPTLNAADFSNVDPLVVSGWGKPSGSVNTRVITLGDSQKVFTRSTAGTAIFQYLTPIVSPVIRIQWRVAQAQANNQNQKGGSILNLSTGTGFCAIHNGGSPGTVEIRAVTSGVMGGSALASAAATANPHNDMFYADYDTVTGEFKLYQAPEGSNPVLKLTHTVTPMTGDLVGGMLMGASLTNIASFTVQAVGGAVTSITDPIVIGSPISVVTTGFSTVTSVTSAGMTATDMSFSAGTTTANWPALADGMVIPSQIPITDSVVTVSDGSSPATINADINHAPNFVTTPVGTVITDPAYLGSVYSFTTGWAIYYDDTQLGGMEIFPDTRVDVTNDGTFVCFVHELGSGNDLVELTVTVNGGAIVPTITATNHFIGIGLGIGF